MNTKTSLFLAGLCTLLFGGAVANPSYLSPSIVTALLRVKSQTATSGFWADRCNIARDVKAAEAKLFNEQQS